MPPDAAPATLPERIGAYRILRVLGRGGMGIVYEAEQESPRRIVALKVVDIGLTREARVRFELEAQVLGRLQHPGIAQIYEAGQPVPSTGGLPYFAMERIEGEPLNAYAADHGLGTRERLELVAKVCDAVHHAHQRGVIHRDLKPGNILVDASGQPKVLDFGVARATDADLRSVTLQTGIGQLVGTIPYMSPEQASGDPGQLDTRSDVYSLGVVAYELVSRRLPYELDASSVIEASRIVREVEPHSLSSIDARLRGDVETIIGKALEKDPDRRYSSAAAFAADIRRYLAHEPISARPPSTLYQLSKFARRNKALVIGVAAVFVALVAGLVGTTMGYLEAGRRRDEATVAKDEALASAERASRTSEFLQSLLSGIDPAEAQGLDTTLLHRILSDTEARIADELEGLPLVEAEIRETIGVTYAAIGDVASALPHTQAAHELYRKELGEHDVHTLETEGQVGSVLRRLDRYAEAERYLTSAAEGARETLAPGAPVRLFIEQDLAVLYYDTDRLEESLELIRDVLARMRESSQVPESQIVNASVTLSTLLLEVGRLDEAETLLGELLARASERLGEDHPLTLRLMSNRAALAGDLGRTEEALRLRRDLIERSKRVYGDDHLVTRSSMRAYARLVRDQGRWEEADELLGAVLESCERQLGPEHTETLETRRARTHVWKLEARYDEAIAELRAVQAAFERTLGPAHRQVVETRAALGQVLTKAKRRGEAEPILREVLAAREADPTTDAAGLLQARADLAEALMGLQRHDEAEPLLRAVLAERRERFGPDHPETLVAHNSLALGLLYQGRLPEALEEFLQSVDEHRRVRGSDHPETFTTLYNTGAVYKELGRLEEALPYLVEAAEGWQRAGGPGHPNARATRDYLLGVLADLDRPAVEEPWRAVEVELARKAGAAGPALAALLVARADPLVRLERTDEAIPLLEEALELQFEVRADDPELAWTQALYGEALVMAGREDEGRELLSGTLELLGPVPPERRERVRKWLDELEADPGPR